MRAPSTFRAAALCALSWVLLSSSAGAQNPPAAPPPQNAASTPAASPPRYRFRILGVFDEDTGDPVEGVEVRDILNGSSSVTSKTGTVSLFFLPDSGSLVRLRKVGYEMQTFPVSITPNDTAPVTVILKKMAQQLPTVTVHDSAPHYVSPLLRGAAERMNAHQGGYFIDEATMRKSDNTTLANLLVAKVSGLMTVAGARGTTLFVSSRTPCRNAFGCTKPDCFIRVMVDGVQMSGPQDYARMMPSEFAMVEFYPGGASVPPQFGGTNDTSCGVLLLWSRER